MNIELVASTIRDIFSTTHEHYADEFPHHLRVWELNPKTKGYEPRIKRISDFPEGTSKEVIDDYIRDYNEYQQKTRNWKNQVEYADDVAKDLNFPKDDIHLTQKDYEFNLNNKALHAAGTYSPNTGKITLYEKHMSAFPTLVKNVVAHEIHHHIFRTVWNAHQAEMEAINDHDYPSDGSFVPRDQRAMRMDGTINEAFRDQFPATHALNSYSGSSPNWKKLEKAGGFTSYSKQWWEAYKNRTANSMQALNEAFAEAGANMYLYGNKPLGTPTVYRAMVRDFRKVYKKVKA